METAVRALSIGLFIVFMLGIRRRRAYSARSTLPERRQRVQAYTWVGLPFTIALTRRTFGFQARFARRWEWETRIPNVTPLPQNSHFAILSAPPLHEGYLHNSGIIAEHVQKSKRFLKKIFFFRKKTPIFQKKMAVCSLQMKI